MKKRQEYDVHLNVIKYLGYKYPSALVSSDLGGLKLTKGIAIKAKALRPKRGHPDLVIYEPRLGYAALFVELKLEDVKLKYSEATKGPRGSIDEHQAEQYEYMQALEKRGFACSFAVGFNQTKALIDAYFGSDLELFNNLKTKF